VKFAKYWSKQTVDASVDSGVRGRFSARGWSDQSVEAAADLARSIAMKVGQIVLSGRGVRERYEYGDQPIPEPVVSEFNDGDGIRGAVTRNAYGALVLNARDLMFIDVDVRPPPLTVGNVLSGVAALFRKTPAVPPKSDGVVERFRETATAHDLTIRLYKTAGGYRGIATNSAFDPNDETTRSLLAEFGADELYVRLCTRQHSFRARLTPKPWRMGLSAPAVTFPFATPRDQQKFDAWLAAYDKATERFAVCAFIDTVGTEQIGGQFEDLISLHDGQTKATSGLPLA